MRSLNLWLIAASLVIGSPALEAGTTRSEDVPSVSVRADGSENTPDIVRRIRYRYELRNPSRTSVRDARIHVYAPVAQSASQRTVHVDASHAHSLQRDALGNQIMEFVIDLIPPGGVHMLTIEATLTLSAAPWRDALDDVAAYLEPSTFIESDHPSVIALASSLSQRGPVATQRAFYDWVRMNLTDSGYSGRDRGALFALEKRHGDCTEFSYLFTALSRAQGVPTRILDGYVLTDDDVLSPAQLHTWAEFFWAGAWHLADPHGDAFMEGYARYVALRIGGVSRSGSAGHRIAHVDPRLEVRMR